MINVSHNDPSSHHRLWLGNTAASVMSGRAAEPGVEVARRRRSHKEKDRRQSRRSGGRSPVVRHVTYDGDHSPGTIDTAVQERPPGNDGVHSTHTAPARHSGGQVTLAEPGDPRELQELERGLDNLCNEAGHGLHAAALCRRGSSQRLLRPETPMFAAGRQLMPGTKSSPACSDAFFLGAHASPFRY